jgi:hypothetical protein
VGVRTALGRTGTAALAALLLAGCAANPGGKGAHDSLPGYADAHFGGEAWGENVGRGYLSSPAVLVPAALAAGALAVHSRDDDIGRRQFGQWGEREAIGDAGMGILVLGSLAAGALDPREGRTARDETWMQAEAYLLTTGVTMGLKALTDRRRPDHRGDDSFPSGHTSAAFAGATLIWRNNGPWLGVPAYAIAAAVGYSRVESGRHFTSDVLAGAAIGTLVAGVVDSLHWAPDGATPYVVPIKGGVEVGIVVDF